MASSRPGSWLKFRRFLEFLIDPTVWFRRRFFPPRRWDEFQD